MRSTTLYAALTIYTLLLSPANAAEYANTSPQAGGRTNAQNYKDMILATCMAQAYQADRGAAADAGSSVSALRDWTNFDMERSPDAVKLLVDGYLAKDYSNPLVESEIKGIRFDLLKCLDLYHSKGLEELARRLVIHPNRTYRQSAPSQKMTRKAGQ